MNNIPLAALAAASLLSLASAASGATRGELFNSGWRFHLADSVAMQLPSKGWENVTLPHDWSIRNRFDRDAVTGNDGGYLPAGMGYYRNNLKMKEIPADRKLRLYIEGAYENSEVIINGHSAGGHPYGYTSYFVDITPYLKKGDNDILIKVDNSRQKNSRWYTGSGLYRNVRLIETADTHVADHGVAISTPALDRAVVDVTVDNSSAKARDLTVAVEIDGNTQSSPLSVGAWQENSTTLSFSLPEARAWSPDAPNLYTARISVSENGKVLDTVEERFGFKTIDYSAQKGFLLNGEPLLLNGGCAHHDNGILGAAAYGSAERRKARLLKEAGFNAVRTSHNIPSEAFLDACDEFGLLVIDEAFDTWRDAKNSHDYHLLFDEWAAKDAAAMVRRDRNHPSVFCWSIGNEIIERKKPQAVEDARMLAETIKAIDSTRPVTQALAAWDPEWTIFDPLAAKHDIVGYNYMIHKAESDHERVPSRVMMQTESYPADTWKNYAMVKYHPYVIGDFVWTAIDYIGESGIGRWYYEGDVPGEHYHRPLYPWHAAYCGDIDLTGLRKPVSHYRSMLWNEDGEKLYMAVKEPDGYIGKIKLTQWGTWPTFESWNWPGHEGKPIEVEVCSRYPLVRLYQDDSLVGEQAPEEMKAVFTVDYSPGSLRAEGVENGKVMETVELHTAGDVAALCLTPEERSEDDDLVFVSIEGVDADGRSVPVADNEISVSLDGPFELLAIGNADIKDEDPYFDATHRLWKGRALAVLRPLPAKAKTGKPRGTMKVTLKTDENRPAVFSLPLR